MKQLYKIADDHRAIMEVIDSGDFTAEEMADTIDGAVGEFNDKAQSVLAYEKGLDSDIGIIDAEIKRLQSRKRALSNKKQSMRDYLKTNMIRTDITNIKCPLFSITLAKGREKLIIDDQEKIPDEYIQVEVVQTVDKKRLLSDIKSGAEVPGCHSEEGEKSLRIT